MSSSISTRPSDATAAAGTRSALIDKIIARAIAADPPRAGSLIVTLFGDAVSQHGNSVWLGSVIDGLRPFGLNPRQIRTAVFRLVKDDWLRADQIGRRSFYALTANGRREYERAAQRIYAREPADWDGSWTLVVPGSVTAKSRDLLRRELGWLGFGQLGGGLLAHPGADSERVVEILTALGLQDRVAVMRAQNIDAAAVRPLQLLVNGGWKLDELDRRFRGFVKTFASSVEEVSNNKYRDPAQSFELRIIMVHEYRRILLKAPALPDALLPERWAGTTARELIATVYCAVRDASLAHMAASFECADGPLPAPERGFYERFA